MKIPEIIKPEGINLDPLMNICREYLEFLNSDEYHEDNDFDNYIFEAALETIYGRNVWDYVNSKMK